ncbi:MAG TPA: CoA transferase, partial [Dehalococcoidia bacterium]|nr:CoA transferase [Dehalococcoidia bacterium]
SILQSVSGIVHEESGDGPPHHMPAQALDYVSGYLLAFGIMRALALRAFEGGSYLVRVSLAQTGAWIQRLGRTDLDENGLWDDDVSELLVETPSAFGTLTHLRPVVGLSETPAYWARPSVPLGSSPAQWPSR